MSGAQPASQLVVQLGVETILDQSNPQSDTEWYAVVIEIVLRRVTDGIGAAGFLAAQEEEAPRLGASKERKVLCRAQTQRAIRPYVCCDAGASRVAAEQRQRQRHAREAAGYVPEASTGRSLAETLSAPRTREQARTTLSVSASVLTSTG